MPDHFKALDKHVAGSITTTGADARLALKKPIQVGFGGERVEGNEYELGTMMQSRPDDGALLYCCLEPIELAHDPFRKGDRSQHTMYASRGYKSSNKSVISAKRPFGCEGGVGRATPRFINKLRSEAHLEMRLSIGARSGAGAFVRRKYVSGWYNKEGLKTKKSSEDTYILVKTDVADSGASNKTNTLSKDGEISYEQIIGASSILHSSALAPMIMRDWSLCSLKIKTLLPALSKVERADGAVALKVLFAKLSALFRPLQLGQLRLIGEDLETIPSHVSNASEQLDQQNRQKHYVDLSEHLLSLLTSPGLYVPESNGITKAKGNGTHWKSQVLITTVLYFLLRNDRPPSAAVADFFIRSMVSDIMDLRRVSSRAVFSCLALSGDSALMTGSSVIGSKEYVRKLIHTPALNHYDGSDGGRRRIHLAAIGGLGVTFLSRTNDDTLNLARVRYYEIFARIFVKDFHDAGQPSLTELVETIKLKRERIIEAVKDEDVRVAAGEVLAGLF
ncbi:hypothetical protein FGB62_67g04 [Gracilaria domingensis]|nr:hypothetical protein FGB62_67g04 [Gracilaria domingensis]